MRAILRSSILVPLLGFSAVVNAQADPKGVDPLATIGAFAREFCLAADSTSQSTTVELSGEDLVAGGDDRVLLFGFEIPEVVIRERAGLLDDGERLHELGEARQGNPGQREVLERPKRLHPVVRVRRNLPLPKRIVLLPGRRRRA